MLSYFNIVWTGLGLDVWFTFSIGTISEEFLAFVKSWHVTRSWHCTAVMSHVYLHVIIFPYIILGIMIPTGEIMRNHSFQRGWNHQPAKVINQRKTSTRWRCDFLKHGNTACCSGQSLYQLVDQPTEWTGLRIHLETLLNVQHQICHNACCILLLIF